MPMIRVSDPMHEAISELAEVQESVLKRTVTANQVIEMLVASYRRTVERESEDDYDYSSREPRAARIQDPGA